MKMKERFKIDDVSFVVIVGIMAWLIPGAGYFVLKEQKRAILIFVAVTILFILGIYIGSVAVVDPEHAAPWYVAQLLSSPCVAAAGHLTRTRGYQSFGKPHEIGQVYTTIAGMLNLLCIVSSMYTAHLRKIEAKGI